jgi:hypothetical protein
MNVNPASEKLTKILFNNQVDWETYPTALYLCNNCKSEVTLALKDLMKHQFESISNLTPLEKTEIEELLRNTNISKSNSFLDFHCPGCKKPVRVYYGS